MEHLALDRSSPVVATKREPYLLILVLRPEGESAPVNRELPLESILSLSVDDAPSAFPV